MTWYMLGYILLLSVKILTINIESWHKVDSRSSYRNDSNYSKIITEDRRGAQNLFLGLGVRTVTPASTKLFWGEYELFPKYRAVFCFIAAIGMSFLKMVFESGKFMARMVLVIC